MRTSPLPLLALVVVSGCGWGGGSGSGGGGGTWAPQITYSFPEDGILDLPADGSLTFSVTGEDVDSLDLLWEWQLNSAPQAFGETSDGTFEESWTLEWSEDLSGFLHDIHFVVTDPDNNSTELYWPVQVD